MADNSTRTRFGIANPERIENPLWLSSIARYWPAWRLRELAAAPHEAPTHVHEFSSSNYRDATPGPFWSWQRMGRTSTPLLDGRIVHVAGEHEDSYDSIFCIYNDVVVEHPDGRLEILLYPKSIFPPTDFHSATLIEGTIFLIGSLGYHDLRKLGETQVLKLDTDTLQSSAWRRRAKAPAGSRVIQRNSFPNRRFGLRTELSKHQTATRKMPTHLLSISQPSHGGANRPVPSSQKRWIVIVRNSKPSR